MLVRSFAREFNLQVGSDSTSAARRTIWLTGAATDMQEAFGIVLEQKTIDGVEYRVREGGIHLPASLLDSVIAVLGLDNRPQAKPHFRIRRPHAVSTSYTPVQVAQAYQFPLNASGAGQTTESSNLVAATDRQISPLTSSLSAWLHPPLRRFL